MYRELIRQGVEAKMRALHFSEATIAQVAREVDTVTAKIERDTQCSACGTPTLDTVDETERSAVSSFDPDHDIQVFGAGTGPTLEGHKRMIEQSEEDSTAWLREEIVKLARLVGELGAAHDELKSRVDSTPLRGVVTLSQRFSELVKRVNELESNRLPARLGDLERAWDIHTGQSTPRFDTIGFGKSSIHREEEPARKITLPVHYWLQPDGTKARIEPGDYTVDARGFINPKSCTDRCSEGHTFEAGCIA